jgi:hypothetical protein
MDFNSEREFIRGLVIKTVKIILPVWHLLQMVMTGIRGWGQSEEEQMICKYYPQIGNKFAPWK